eukprot:2245765-Amphidinium_carterae.1
MQVLLHKALDGCRPTRVLVYHIKFNFVRHVLMIEDASRICSWHLSCQVDEPWTSSGGGEAAEPGSLKPEDLVTLTVDYTVRGSPHRQIIAHCP